MNIVQGLPARAPDARLDGILKLAILAVGGQGGGVLTGWIEALARAQGYVCQATSVAGVAQRTGATIYYIEMTPREPGAPDPVFSLAPAAGDVDVVIAAEMMEAGRAIIRGFVTPDRTTLIASTHRALAVSEKSVPGNGIASSEEVQAAAEIAARRLIMADMDKAATGAGSAISASLFGALAASAALPFGRDAFEAAIRASGRGVEASLRAFEAGFTAATAPADKPLGATATVPALPSGPATALTAWEALVARARALPAPVAELAMPGLRKVVDFQDLAYGAEYLDRLDRVLARDDAAQGHVMSREAAKYIANAMAYDDIIRVADRKTRPRRFVRIRSEMNADADKVMHLTEFLHPRAEEIVGLLPVRLGARLEADPKKMARIDRLVNRGRRLRTDGILSFTILWVLGGMQGWRRRTHRHAVETAHLDRWLATALSHLPERYDVAVEIVRCRRLVKGYSDTHARGLSKFDRVLAGAALVAGRKDGPEWIARLREAALQDEDGKALDGAILTVRSFAGPDEAA